MDTGATFIEVTDEWCHHCGAEVEIMAKRGCWRFPKLNKNIKGGINE